MLCYTVYKLCEQGESVHTQIYVCTYILCCTQVRTSPSGHSVHCDLIHRPSRTCLTRFLLWGRWNRLEIGWNVILFSSVWTTCKQNKFLPTFLDCKRYASTFAEIFNLLPIFFPVLFFNLLNTRIESPCISVRNLRVWIRHRYKGITIREFYHFPYCKRYASTFAELYNLFPLVFSVLFFSSFCFSSETKKEDHSIWHGQMTFYHHHSYF